MNPTDPAADPFDVRKLTLEMAVRLPTDPAVLQDMVIDLMALIHHQRQKTQQLKQVVDLLERFVDPSPGPSAPRKKKRRRH